MDPRTQTVEQKGGTPAEQQVQVLQLSECMIVDVCVCVM